MRISRHATLGGLEAPSSGRSIEVKPYVLSGLQTNNLSDPVLSNETHADAGLDVKFGVTESLFADLTVNTDFAQVEADERPALERLLDHRPASAFDPARAAFPKSLRNRP